MSNSFLAFTLFGAKHLWGEVIFIALVICALALTFRFTNYKEYQTQQKTIFTLSIIFILEESIKIIYKWITQGVSFSLIPLYFCSIPIYLLPVLYFTKGKLKEFLKPSLVVICLVGSISMYFYPVPLFISSNSWFPLSNNVVQIISMISHSVMLYTAVYILASEMYKPKIKHLFISVVPYLIMTVISLGTSLLVWDYEQIDYNGMVNGVNIKFVQDVMSIHPAFFIFMYLGALTLLASIILGLGQCFTTPKKFPTQETTV